MTDTPETTEGRILAHRKILARILHALAAGRTGPDILDELKDRRQLELHAEDPGAVPDPALAIEGAIADEMRQVLDLARAGGSGRV
jgi:hypothetical protein